MKIDRRAHYEGQPIPEAENPVELLAEWLELALLKCAGEPHAMALSTATLDGAPSSRFVLLRSFDETGLVFYSNYSSRKGKELAANPRACGLFYWNELHRQVRIEGTVKKISQEASDRYFESRPRGSQLASACSEQSSELISKGQLKGRVEELDEKYKGSTIPRPEWWGGFSLVPEAIEFWSGMPDRLHQRILYTLDSGSVWKRRALQP